MQRKTVVAMFVGEWLEFGAAVLLSMEERWDFSTAVENGYVLEHSNGEHVPNNTVQSFLIL